MRVLSLLLLSFQLTKTVASNVDERKLTTVEDTRDLVGEPANPNPLGWAHESGNHFQGDMKLSYEQVKAAFGAEVANFSAARGELFDVGPSVPGNGRDLALISSNLWNTRNQANNKVQIPYNFVPGAFTSSGESSIVGWLNEMNLECPVEFIMRTTEAHYISIQSSESGCWSYVGDIGSFLSPQPLNLGNGCVYDSVVKHEFLHAAGFYHEQSRNDRDDYVIINTENIQTGLENNFDKQTNTASLGAPYDYTSIMHYGAYFFSKNNLKTLTTVGKPGGSDALDQTLGTHDDLSTGDKLQLKLLYQCTTGPRTLTAYTANPCTDDCQCCQDETGCTSNTHCQGTLFCLAGTCTASTAAPTIATPTVSPTSATPTVSPTFNPTAAPTPAIPTVSPTSNPTAAPTTATPTVSPTTATPTLAPVTDSPTTAPTPTVNPPPITEAPVYSPTVAPTLSPDQVVDVVEEILDPETVNALVAGILSEILSIITGSTTPGANSLVVVTVSIIHFTAALTPAQLVEIQESLFEALNSGIVVDRRYLQADDSGLELISVGDTTIVDCPNTITEPCVGTANEVTYATAPITTSAPTTKSGKGSKSSKGTSSPTVPGITTSPTKAGKSDKSGKSGKSGKGRMRI